MTQSSNALAASLFLATGSIDATAYATLLERARGMGFQGFGGACAHAAMAINAVVFQGHGQLVGCFNAAFEARGRLLGHVAVRLNDPRRGEVFLDADGSVKGFDEIESWGMLDESDLDHQEQARAMGFALDEDTASEVATFEMDDADVIEHFGQDALDLVAILQRAVEVRALEQVAASSSLQRPTAPSGDRPAQAGLARPPRR